MTRGFQRPQRLSRTRCGAARSAAASSPNRHVFHSGLAGNRVERKDPLLTSYKNARTSRIDDELHASTRSINNEFPVASRTAGRAYDLVA